MKKSFVTAAALIVCVGGCVSNGLGSKRSNEEAKVMATKGARWTGAAGCDATIMFMVVFSSDFEVESVQFVVAEDETAERIVARLIDRWNKPGANNQSRAALAPRQTDTVVFNWDHHEAIGFIVQNLAEGKPKKVSSMGTDVLSGLTVIKDLVRNNFPE